MKILVTGAGGQLGRDLVRILSKEHKVFGYSRHELDITDPAQVLACLRQLKPHAVVHAAAYTKVDLAETEKEQAYLVNAYGTRNVAVAAQSVGAKMAYVSTDYVFDGKTSTPYHEFDETNPLNVYGNSKLAGEEFVRSFSDKFFIVRTSWVYGVHGTNFVKTMLKMAEERNELRVVSDQIGSPTYTVDLCQFIGELMTTEKYGIYHASNAGRCSWHEFATVIFEETQKAIRVVPIKTGDFPRPAIRPAFSVLDHMSIRLNDFSGLRHWKEALKDFLKVYSRKD
ncbi:dTDP-4-dehydrorhamnose reductase [Ammoniphilus sp. 3BR4]|uniref:dTDP-4-dehydrorhamnose reductase n=1 Tax=Ammoniphilus sp. 3BR4 TaxID=3158265 RepID=UPI003466970F